MGDKRLLLCGLFRKTYNILCSTLLIQLWMDRIKKATSNYNTMIMRLTTMSVVVDLSIYLLQNI